MSWGQGSGWGQQAPPGQYGGQQQAYGGHQQRPSAPPGGAPSGYGAAPGYGAPPAGQYGAPPPGQYGAPPPGQHGAPPPGQYGAPPPGQYGAAPPGQHGAPPPGQYGAPPPGQYGAPPPRGHGGYAPAPPPGVSPDLWQWFQAVDQDNSGKITGDELQRALMNGNWTPFNAETCRLMIGMFDKDRNGTIDCSEFAALWKYIQDWKNCFDGFDQDRSGNIDAQELNNAFKTFGYNLSAQFCSLCVRVFDRKSVNTMNFDDFIQCCVMLKSLTNKFQAKDTNHSGVVNISYEDFLEMVLDTTLNK